MFLVSSEQNEQEEEDEDEEDEKKWAYDCWMPLYFGSYFAREFQNQLFKLFIISSMILPK